MPYAQRLTNLPRFLSDHINESKKEEDGERDLESEKQRETEK